MLYSAHPNCKTVAHRLGRLPRPPTLGDVLRLLTVGRDPSPDCGPARNCLPTASPRTRRHAAGDPESHTYAASRRAQAGDGYIHCRLCSPSTHRRHPGPFCRFGKFWTRARPDVTGADLAELRCARRWADLTRTRVRVSRAAPRTLCLKKMLSSCRIEIKAIPVASHAVPASD